MTKKVNFVRHFKQNNGDGNGLIIKGEVGTGKTVLLSLICKILLDYTDFIIVSNIRFTNEVYLNYPNRIYFINSLSEYFNVYSKTPYGKPLLLAIDDSQGNPDLTSKNTMSKGGKDFGSIRVEPLERLARNVTVRLLYTSAVIGRDWQTMVKRRRVKVWTQDAEVLLSWKDPKIMLPDKQMEDQKYFFSWVKDNVDFGVRSRRVD